MPKTFFVAFASMLLLTGCSSGPKVHSIVSGSKNTRFPKALHFVTPQVGYCADADSTGAVELHRSLDAGRSWQSVASSTAFKGSGSFTVSSIGFWNEKEGIVTGRGGTLYTSDGGSSWSYKNPLDIGGFAWEAYSARAGQGGLILSPRGSGTALQVHGSGGKPGEGPVVRAISNLPSNHRGPIFVNGGQFEWLESEALVAWCSSEVYFTTDAGKTWKTPLADNISPYRNDGDEIYALSVLAGPEFRYFTYRQETKRLEFVISKPGSSPRGFDEEASEVLFDGKDGTLVKDLHFFDPARGVVLNGDDVFSTKDGGKSWQLLATVPHQENYNDRILEVVNQDKAFVAFQQGQGISLLEFDPTPE